MTSPSRDQFNTWVRDALGRLYDTAFLRGHDLAELLADSEPCGLQRGEATRRFLLDAIHSIQPAAKTPAQSRDYRSFQILTGRYLEGRSPDEVMQQLAISRSLYFREQARALDLLANAAWERYQRRQAASVIYAPLTAVELGDADPRPTGDISSADAHQLIAQAVWEEVDLAGLLRQIKPIVELLGREHAVAVAVTANEPAMIVRADRVLLRFVLLRLVQHALETLGGGRLSINSYVHGRNAGMRLEGSAASTLLPLAATRTSGSLAICHELVAAMGGRMTIEPCSQQQWRGCFEWATVTAPILLVIDDSAGLVELFRRYLASSSWQVIGAVNGDEARRIMRQTAPTVVLLDLFLPREDGWEILVSLRAQEATRATPVIVCSILTEPELVKALGATAYLRKPVARSTLLQTLAAYAPAGSSQPIGPLELRQGSA